MDLGQVRNLVNSYLKEPNSPGKVDKYETLELKEKLTAKGEVLTPAVKEFIKDQIASGKFEKGSAVTSLEGLVNTPDAPKPKTKLDVVKDQLADIDKQITAKQNWLNNPSIKNYSIDHWSEIKEAKADIISLREQRSTLTTEIASLSTKEISGADQASFIQDRLKQIDHDINAKRGFLNSPSIKNYSIDHIGEIRQAKADIASLQEEKKSLLGQLGHKPE